MSNLRNAHVPLSIVGVKCHTFSKVMDQAYSDFTHSRFLDLLMCEDSQNASCITQNVDSHFPDSGLQVQVFGVKHII